MRKTRLCKMQFIAVQCRTSKPFLLSAPMNKPSSQSKLYAFAESQAGYFSARQAQQAGYCKAQLADHAGRAKFQRVRHGVYRPHHFPEQPHADLFVVRLPVVSEKVLPREKVG